MRVLRAANYQSVPWKNGLGTTREILKHPQSAADFIYRLSIAEVRHSGAFSAFPGYDRFITLLDGDGFELRFADGRTHALTSRHVPFRFDGGMPVSCTVKGGPSQDLNLMIRCGTAQADCAVQEVAGPLVLPPATGVCRLLVGLSEDITVRCGGHAAVLGCWDTVSVAAAGVSLGEVVCESVDTALIFHAVIALTSAGDTPER